MRLLTIIILFFASPCFGGFVVYLPSGGGTCGDSWVIDSDFEDESDDSQWTSVDGSDDYSTSGLSLEGSECIRSDAGENATIEFNGASTIYCIYMWRFEDQNESQLLLLKFYDSADNELGRVQYDSDNDLRSLASGGTASDWIADVSTPDNTVWIKVRYTAGSGSDAIFNVTYWTGAAWDTWTTSTDGTDTTDCDNITFYNDQDGTGVEYQYLDSVYVSTTDFTNAPTSYCHP